MRCLLPQQRPSPFLLLKRPPVFHDSGSGLRKKIETPSGTSSDHSVQILNRMASDNESTTTYETETDAKSVHSNWTARKNAKEVESYYTIGRFRCMIARTKYGDIPSFEVKFPNGMTVGNHPTDEYNFLEITKEEDWVYGPHHDLYVSLDIEMLDLILECEVGKMYGTIHIEHNSGDVFCHNRVPREALEVFVSVVKNTPLCKTYKSTQAAYKADLPKKPATALATSTATSTS